MKAAAQKEFENSESRRDDPAVALPLRLRLPPWPGTSPREPPKSGKKRITQMKKIGSLTMKDVRESALQPQRDYPYWYLDLADDMLVDVFLSPLGRIMIVVLRRVIRYSVTVV